MRIEWKTCFKVGVSIFLLYLCIHYWMWVSGFLAGILGAISPLFIGAVIAYIVNLPMGFYEKIYFKNTKKKWLIKSRRPVCMVAAYASILAIIAVILMLVIPQLIDCVKLIIAEVPKLMKELVKQAERIEYLPDEVLNVFKGMKWESWIGKIAGVVSTGVGNVLGTVISTVTMFFSGIFMAFLSITFSIYLLSGKEKICAGCHRVVKRLFTPKHCGAIEYVQRTFNDSFKRYIVGQCTEAVILGVLCIIGMVILRIPYESMIGALVAFTALIPVVGAFIGAGIGAFMILTVDPIKAIIFVVFIVVLQQLEGNLIYPRVVGSNLGLPALLVLAAVTVGGGVMGIVGILLAVPITAALWNIFNDLLDAADEREAAAIAKEAEQVKID